MLDESFAKWWLGRVQPYVDVPDEKLSAEREGVKRQQEFNNHYEQLLTQAVLPSVERLTQLLRKQRVVHRVSTWGNQLSIRVHLAWRWGELIIAQSHEDAVTFEHHIVTEGEKRGEDTSEDHSHQYDLRDPIPGAVAINELYFFLGRMAQDLVEPEDEPELPPGEQEPGA
ncbi:MAG: hypothetical protein ACFCVE_12100 [Phycisphaerae bacterium]